MAKGKVIANALDAVMVMVGDETQPISIDIPSLPAKGSPDLKSEDFKTVETEPVEISDAEVIKEIIEVKEIPATSLVFKLEYPSISKVLKGGL